MDSKNTIRALLAMRGINSAAVAAGQGITVAAARNKVSRNSWSLDDLIKLAATCGVRLAFVDDNGRAVLTFSEPPADNNN